MTWLFYALLALTAVLTTLTIFNPWLGSWVCRLMDWHLVSGPESFDGCSQVAHCRRCGRQVLQDSQGNWFGV